MIRFTDVAPDAKPKKAAAQSAEPKAPPPPEAADTPNPAKAARKTRKSA